MNTNIIKKLKVIKKANLYRKLRTFKINNDQTMLVDNIPAICFSSNDYLGLTQHPRLIEASMSGVKQYGTGAGASRLVTGNQKYHLQLEEQLAQFKNREKALLFGSGYLANVGLLSTLPSQKDLLLNDSLNHASILDGCRLTKAKVVDFPHNDMNWVRDYLQENRNKFDQAYLFTEGVFSMDGDLAPLPDIYKLADQFSITIILDEAHSTGVIGDQGKGIENFYKLNNPNTIIIGTLGKALGSYGAFVCGSKELIDLLINRARTFIFSTALPPSVIISASEAIKLLSEEPEIYKQLRNNINTLNENINQLGIQVESNSAIFPIVIGDAKLTMQLTEELLSEGLFIQGIRPPTVPNGTSRLRITLSALHTKHQIIKLSEVFYSYLKKYNLL